MIISIHNYKFGLKQQDILQTLLEATAIIAASGIVQTGSQRSENTVDPVDFRGYNWVWPSKCLRETLKLFTNLIIFGLYIH